MFKNTTYNDLKNMCRTCMITSDLKPIEKTLIDILQVIPNINYSKTDELPQQLCINCIKIINEMHDFTLKCKQSYISFKKYLVHLKNDTQTINTNQIDLNIIKQEADEEIETPDIKNLDFEEIMLKEEINEENTDFIPINNDTTLQSNHENPYECEVCNKTFKTKRNFTQHKKVHNPTRRFECDVCKKSFKQSCHLIQHKRIHSGERPYKCDICTKSFSQKSNLMTHKTMHNSERRYECNICFKGFQHSSHLIEHKRVHSGERPYQCDVCDKRFSQKSYLIKHKVVTHINERLLQCNVCSNDLRKNK